MNRDYALRSIFLGWHDLINQFYDKVDEWNLHNPENMITVHSVKQKWGDLRISFSPSVKEVYDTYRKINKKSNTICEMCGNTGKYTDMYYNGEHWMYVLCDSHNKMHPIDYMQTKTYE